MPSIEHLQDSIHLSLTVSHTPLPLKGNGGLFLKICQGKLLKDNSPLTALKIKTEIKVYRCWNSKFSGMSEVLNAV